MLKMQYRWMELPVVALFGADGDEEESADPQEGAEGEGDDKPVVDKFDAEYVTSLRKENADRRIKAKEADERATAAEAALAEIRKAEMTDLDAAKTDLEAANARAEVAEAKAQASDSTLKSVTIQNAVTMAAIEAGFEDPSDALSMISQDDLVDDEGNILPKTVKARLKSLADKKPYLLKKSRPGSGDGGPTGTPPDPTDFAGKRDAYLKDMTESGGRIIVGS